MQVEVKGREKRKDGQAILPTRRVAALSGRGSERASDLVTCQAGRSLSLFALPYHDREAEKVK